MRAFVTFLALCAVAATIPHAYAVTPDSARFRALQQPVQPLQQAAPQLAPSFSPILQQALTLAAVQQQQRSTHQIGAPLLSNPFLTVTNGINSQEKKEMDALPQTLSLTCNDIILDPSLPPESVQPCCDGLRCPFAGGTCCKASKSCCPRGTDCLPLIPGVGQQCGTLNQPSTQVVNPADTPACSCNPAQTAANPLGLVGAQPQPQSCPCGRNIPLPSFGVAPFTAPNGVAPGAPVVPDSLLPPKNHGPSVFEPNPHGDPLDDQEPEDSAEKSGVNIKVDKPKTRPVDPRARVIQRLRGQKVTGDVPENLPVDPSTVAALMKKKHRSTDSATNLAQDIAAQDARDDVIADLADLILGNSTKYKNGTIDGSLVLGTGIANVSLDVLALNGSALTAQQKQALAKNQPDGTVSDADPEDDPHVLKFSASQATSSKPVNDDDDDMVDDGVPLADDNTSAKDPLPGPRLPPQAGGVAMNDDGPQGGYAQNGADGMKGHQQTHIVLNVHVAGNGAPQQITRLDRDSQGDGTGTKSSPQNPNKEPETSDEADAREAEADKAVQLNTQIKQQQTMLALKKEQRTPFCVSRTRNPDALLRTMIFKNDATCGNALGSQITKTFEPYLTFFAYDSPLPSTVVHCVRSSKDSLWRMSVDPGSSSCSSDSWNQEFTFYAYTSFRPGTVPFCIKESTDPNQVKRVYIDPGKTDCSSKYWKMVGVFFAFAQQGNPKKVKGVQALPASGTTKPTATATATGNAVPLRTGVNPSTPSFVEVEALVSPHKGAQHHSKPVGKTNRKQPHASHAKKKPSAVHAPARMRFAHNKQKVHSPRKVSNARMLVAQQKTAKHVSAAAPSSKTVTPLHGADKMRFRETLGSRTTAKTHAKVATKAKVHSKSKAKVATTAHATVRATTKTHVKAMSLNAVRARNRAERADAMRNAVDEGSTAAAEVDTHTPLSQQQNAAADQDSEERAPSPPPHPAAREEHVILMRAPEAERTPAEPPAYHFENVRFSSTHHAIAANAPPAAPKHVERHLNKAEQSAHDEQLFKQQMRVFETPTSVAV